MLNVFIASSYIITNTSVSFISYILSIFLYPIRSCSDTSQLRENSILLFFLIISSHVIISFSIVPSSCVRHDTPYIRTRKIRERSMRCVSRTIFKERMKGLSRGLDPCIYMEEILVKIHSFRRSKRPRISLPFLPPITSFHLLTSMLHRRIVRTFLSLVVRDKNFLQNYAENESTLEPVK